jgi:hypothetical protein
MPTLVAEFPDELRADSVIGRLEVLGIPAQKITKISAAGPRVQVSADVEARLVEKARQILEGG